jgi:transposase
MKSEFLLALGQGEVFHLLTGMDATPGMSLEEYRALLLRERGVSFAAGTVWRLFRRRKIT